jgi:hypothetical protein
MKHNIGSVLLAFVSLTVLLSGCSPASTPAPSSPTQVAAASTPAPSSPTQITPTLTPALPSATPVPPTPTAITTPLPTETFYFDTRKKEVKSTVSLADQHQYSIKISGTFSNWNGDYWAQYGICTGTPDKAPVFPIQGLGASPVGQDAFYWYAIPKGPGTKGFCGTFVPPSADSYLTFNTAGDTTFFAYAPVPAFDASHSYVITLTGQGYPLVIDLRDDDYKDNQGEFKIEVLPS